MPITLNITEKLMKNLLTDELKEKKGLIIYTDLQYHAYDISAIHSLWDGVSGAGCHYVIDSTALYRMIPENIKANHLTGGKNTYINQALYNNDPNSSTIGLAIMPDLNYEKAEKRAVQFAAEWLLTNSLTTDNLWREFDLNNGVSPIQYLDKLYWGDKDTEATFVGEVEKWFQNLKNNVTPADKDYKKIYTDEIMLKFIDDISKDSVTYASKFKPDDRGIAAAKGGSADLSKSEIKTIATEVGNNLSYAVAQNPPNGVPGDECLRGTDVAGIKMEPNTVFVEPIYPDLIVTAQSDTSRLNMNDPQAQPTIPGLEDYTKRQQIFNPKNHLKATKTIIGKPVNNNDPFPVDEKIKQLESHDPKVKIDSTEFKVEDCNHPGCPMGVAVQRNFSMLHDMVMADAKRTEQRLVKIENNLSTVMRNLFRMSSRINVNCVYYGGQDVFGKYKCIRCLHPDRVDDGQSMTMDQCLSCSKYEPMIGQIYDILDDTGKNLAVVLDDAQMAYMNMQDVVDLSRVEEMHTATPDAKLKTDPKEKPKQFKEDWNDGFKMDWSKAPLENQNPNVNDYKYEPTTLAQIKSYNEAGGVPEIFQDTRKNADSYETLTYSADKYTLDGFGEYDETLSGGDVFGQGAEDIRKKIVERAGYWVDLCKQGKAGYSQAKRKQTVNGIAYQDCSSLAQECYKFAGLTIGSTTYEQYPQCKAEAGGKLILIANQKDALPGDLVFFSEEQVTDMEKLAPGSVYHVAIYIGDGKIRAASTDKKPLTQQICEQNLYKNAFCFARPQALVEADKKSVSASGIWDPVAQKLPADLQQDGKSMESRAKSTVANMTTNNYKQHVLSISKQKGFDPYVTLALICTESTGNPNDITGSYKGLMQTPDSTGDPAHDIGVGLDMLAKKLKAVGSKNVMLAIYAYNSGEGTVLWALQRGNISNKDTITGGEMAPLVRDTVKDKFPSWSSTEKYQYYSRVLYAYLYLKQLKALE